MSVVDSSFDHPLKIEEPASGPLAGGIMNMGYQCGMVWGGALAAGAQAYQVLGSGPQAEAAAIMASQRIVESFRNRFNSINCMEITDITIKKDRLMQNILKWLKFFLKGGPIVCFRMTARYAPVALSEVNNVLAEGSIEAPPPPISCAAMLAEKMGVSDMHTVMASGFAGGIGLSGGGCGALGAAIWIIGMKGREEGLENKAINARINDTIDRFIRSVDFKYECSEIVGREFEDISDHAVYLRDGGCSEVIQLLATK